MTDSNYKKMRNPSGGESFALKGTKFYKAWVNMKKKCYNIKSDNYKWYGARGIQMSDEWQDFSCFKQDMLDSFNNHVRKFGEQNTTIDRIDNDGNYCKENCRWATWEQQANNRRNSNLVEFYGKTQNLRKWADELGYKYSTLAMRYYQYGWDVRRCLTTPVNKKYL